LATILAIDKDPLHGQMLAFLLRREDHFVITFTDPEQGYELVRQREVDLILLETAHSRHDGYRVCKEFTQLCPTTPLVIVSERTDEDQIVRGLLAGADDYITKPYSPRVLLAHVQATLRRATAPNRLVGSDDTMSIGPISLGREHARLMINGITVELTPTELRLLQVLIANARRVLSRGQLMTLAWGSNFVGTPKTVDVAIVRLRRKLDKYVPNGTLYIKSVRGFGYRLEAPLATVG